MVICPERRVNDLHIVQLMPLPSHPLLLQTPVKSKIMVYLSGTGLPRLSTCPGKRPLNECSVVVVMLRSIHVVKSCSRDHVILVITSSRLANGTHF